MITDARYLLRLDDLCPTMSRSAWERFHALIYEYKLRPILGIVPDNQDIDLILEPPQEAFWQQMRELAGVGASIGLHGLTHLNDQRGRSLVPLHRETEFAGAAEHEQQRKIQRGIHMLEAYGLEAKIWIAPRHGFDRKTLQALRHAGLTCLSDGMASRPFLLEGIVCLPQQLWMPAKKTSGLWTLCVHPSTCNEQQFIVLKDFIERHQRQFIGVDEAMRLFPPSPLRATEAMLAWARITRIRLSKLCKGILQSVQAHLQGVGFAARS